MTQTDGSVPVVDRIRMERGWLVAVAVIALLLGIVGLLFPGASLLTIAIVFGVYLTAAGVYRLVSAFTPGAASGGVRVLVGLIGVLVLVTGIMALSNPFGTIFALGVVIGIGWILEGVGHLALLSSSGSGKRPWQLIVGAVIDIIAGIVMLLLPGAGLQSLILVGSVLLIVLAVVALVNLPSRNAPATAGATR
jgi:uncharacterized membrane protein HdeD (DUF308 family)